MVQTERFKKSQLSYFEEINIKLYSGKCISQDLGNSCKLEIVLAIDKYDKNEKEDKKAKAK